MTKVIGTLVNSRIGIGHGIKAKNAMITLYHEDSAPIDHDEWELRFMEEDEAVQWGEVREYYPGGMVAIPVTHKAIDNFEFKGSFGRLAVMRFESALD